MMNPIERAKLNRQLEGVLNKYFIHCSLSLCFDPIVDPKVTITDFIFRW